MRIRLEKVIVTIFAYESLNIRIENIMTTDPWKMLFHTHIQKVLKFKLRPFYSDLYNGGNLSTASTLVSASNTSENTGKEV